MVMPSVFKLNAVKQFVFMVSVIYTGCCYTGRLYTGNDMLVVFMLDAFMPSVFKLNAVKLFAFMPSVIILDVVILNVVAPVTMQNYLEILHLL